MTGNSQFEGKGATWATFKSEFISIQEFQFTYHVNREIALMQLDLCLMLLIKVAIWKDICLV